MIFLHKAQKVMNEVQPSALVLDPADNVATLLSDADACMIVTLKGAPGCIAALEAVSFGHKIAIQFIGTGEEVRKYGQTIGRATRNIAPGEWVHLHNMASALDADFKKRIDR